MTPQELMEAKLSCLKIVLQRQPNIHSDSLLVEAKELFEWVGAISE